MSLLKRKDTCVLTWLGRLLLLFLVTIAIVFVARFIHPFLAKNSPVYGDVLVVEGWMSDSALVQVLVLLGGRNYQKIITTGGPLLRGTYLSEHNTYAGLGAATLARIGVDQEIIVPVPARSVQKDRTLSSALAVNDWLKESGLSIRSADVYSLGVHARRTQMIFQEVFGENITVGVISAPHPGYDADAWWAWSSGLKIVVGEVIAYFYTCLFLSFEVQRVNQR